MKKKIKESVIFYTAVIVSGVGIIAIVLLALKALGII